MKPKPTTPIDLWQTLQHGTRPRPQPPHRNSSKDGRMIATVLPTPTPDAALVLPKPPGVI